MIPAGLVKDAKQITSHRKGERRAVRKNVQRQAFIRSTEELSSMPSVLASVEPSVVSAGKRESIVNQKNPTLPKKNTAVEKDYAQENAFKHANTAKRVCLAQRTRSCILRSSIFQRIQRCKNSRLYIQKKTIQSKRPKQKSFKTSRRQWWSPVSCMMISKQKI